MPVKSAWVLRRRAVCRYTKMAASTTAAIGKTNVEATKRSGAASPLSEENLPRMTAIEAPEPAMAETNEAISTSFRRIPSNPLGLGCESFGLFEAVLPRLTRASPEYHTIQAGLDQQFQKFLLIIVKGLMV
jgi:hypothetical protein